MNIIVFIVLIICLLYVSLISAFIYGWIKTPIFIATNNLPQTSISVIVAIRNEEENLSQIIDCLANQNYPKHLLEIILVNDHSTDKSLEIILAACNQYSFFKFINLENSFGKKEAIKSAITISSGNLIVTTDADCTMNNNWLRTISSFYETEKPAMIIGPVKMNNKTYFEQMQALEFTSLISSGAGAAAIKSPILCNGANLAYEKVNLINQTDFLQNNISSGDDMFAMINLKKQGKSIRFLKSIDAVVCTNPQKSISEFIQQRLRWTSKTSKMLDLFTIYTAIIVYLINLILLVLMIGSLFNYSLFLLFTGVLLLKTIIDLMLMSKFTAFLNQQKILWFVIPVELGYFLYVSLIGLFSSFLAYKWKGRSY